MNLFPAALLCIAAASIGGRVSADPPQVLIHNGYDQDVVVTITDNNTPNGVVIANQHPMDASADMFVNGALDENGNYNLHWKAQDTGRTKTQEGDCKDTPAAACRIDLLIAP